MQCPWFFFVCERNSESCVSSNLQAGCFLVRDSIGGFRSFMSSVGFDPSDGFSSSDRLTLVDLYSDLFVEHLVHRERKSLISGFTMLIGAADLCSSRIQSIRCRPSVLWGPPLQLLLILLFTSCLAVLLVLKILSQDVVEKRFCLWCRCLRKRGAQKWHQKF